MPKKKVTEAVEETAQETIPVEKAPAQMPRRQGSEDLLELNDLERGVTREDSEEAEWGYPCWRSAKTADPDWNRKRRDDLYRKWHANRSH